MDAFLVMVSDQVMSNLSTDQLDTAFKILHSRMVDKAPEPYPSSHGSVPSWQVELADRRLRGFLELDAGPRGEHMVTLFDDTDVDLMSLAPSTRLTKEGLHRIVFLRTVN